MGDNRKVTADTPGDVTKRKHKKVPGSGGKRRTESEIEVLTKKTEMLMLLGSSRQEMAEALGIPVATVDDYKVRVDQRWRENPLPGRDDAREQAIRRYFKELRTVVSKNGPTKDRATWEDFLVRVQGIEAPRQLVASTPPGQPIQVQLRDPREMTTGERRRRIAELEAEEAAERETVAAAITAAVAVEPKGDAA